MRTIRIRRSLAMLVTGGSLVACAAGSVATPTIVSESAVTATDVFVAPQPLGPITDVAVDAGVITVAAGRGAATLAADGTMLSQIRFAVQRDLYPVRIVNGGSSVTAFAGQESEGRRILLLSSAGSVTASIPAAYAADFAVFPRQSRIAVELPREKAVVFFDFSGTTVARASYPYYTAAMRPQDNSLLTALYPDEHRGTTLYRLEPDGEPRRLHSLHAIGDFAVVSADTYAVIADDAVELRDIESGALRRRLAAPGAGRFRDIAAAFLEDGSVAVALSGRGGVDEHRLLWFSPGNLVEYDRSGPHHSHAVARSGPCEVLVALEDRIERLERPRCGAR